MPLNYENGGEIEFKIDYQKETVKFLNGTINDKTNMYLKEFAISVLKIEPETKEFMAAYIGKETYDSYKKKDRAYILKQIKSRKNYFYGTIKRVNEKHSKH